jgi:site-specific DNA-methyltransferase (adenine-specific)
MIEWVYGSGFPKSLNIGKAVDKIQGNEREVAPNPLAKQQTASKPGTIHGQRGANTHITKGTSPYEGYGTALKPAHEPCVLARKPIEGTVANNVLKHGTGGLNIDGSRVDTEDKVDARAGHSGFPVSTADGSRPLVTQTTGRFPANLIHDGSDEVVGLFPDSKSQSGGTRGSSQIWGSATGEQQRNGFDDSGSAARFFYTAKASKLERNQGLEGFEEVKKNTLNSYGDQSDVEQGDGAKRVGDKGSSVAANFHPTVKPLSLTKYLATLIKPPTGGRLLVPFSGSGSEMIGALQAGWEYVEGVELTEEYIPIAEARIKYWTNISHTTRDKAKSAKISEDIQNKVEQISLI